MQRKIYTVQSEKILRGAWAQAVGMGHSYVGSEHLLLALSEQSGTPAGRLLHWAGLEPGMLRRAILRRSGRGDGTARLPQGLTGEAMDVLSGARAEMRQLGRKRICP